MSTVAMQCHEVLLQNLFNALHYNIAQQPIAIPEGNMQGRRARVGQLSSSP